MKKSEILQLLYNDIERKAEEIYQNELIKYKDKFNDELALQLMAKCAKIGYLTAVFDKSIKAYHNFGLFNEEDLKNVFILGAQALTYKNDDPVKTLDNYIKTH